MCRPGVALILFLCAALPAGAAPILTFDVDQLLIEQATPGGEVVLFAVERVPRGFHESVDVRRESAMADTSGRVTIHFEEGVPVRSVWVVTDLVSGDFALGTPREQGVDAAPFDPDAFRGLATGRADEVRQTSRVMETLWVRPGERARGAGVWGVRVADGGRFDQDAGLDGAFTLRPASLWSIGASGPPPEFFRPGDVVVMIDPRSLVVSAARLEEERGGQGGEG